MTEETINTPKTADTSISPSSPPTQTQPLEKASDPQDTPSEAAPESASKPTDQSAEAVAPADPTPSTSTPPETQPQSTSNKDRKSPLPTEPAPTTTVTDSTKPSSPSPPAETTSSEAKAKSKPAEKSRARRNRPRRRGHADSDSDDSGSNSDDSLTSISSSDGSEDEDEEDEAASGPAVDTKTKKGKSAVPSFPDVSSTTPAAWADEKVDAEETTFDDLNLDGEGKSRSGSQSSRGRGRGRGGALVGDGKEKKVYTEEETKRFEERKAKMRVRQKAKRAELKEAKRKEKAAQADSATPSTPTAGPAKPNSDSKKGKGKKSVDAEDKQLDEIVGSTSALKLDNPDSFAGRELIGAPTDDSSTPSTARGKPGSRDPRLPPRAGQSYTHDQRHQPDQGGFDQFRGRGGFRGAPRGGFRGRGRGGAYGYPDTSRTQNQDIELTPAEEPKRGRGRELEMDKLEAELEAREKARTKPIISPKPEHTEKAEVEGQTPEEKGTAEASDETKEEEPKESAAATVKPPVVAPRGKDKWGHEGFESMNAVEQMRLQRMLMIRGRGRGRGRGNFFPRGGPFRFGPGFMPPTGPRSQFPHVRPLNPNAQQPISSQAQTISAATAASTSSDKATASKPPSEEMLTQPAAESLLTESTQLVTVKLPGGASEVVEIPVKIPTAPVSGASPIAPSESSVPSAQPAQAPSSSGQPITALPGSQIPVQIAPSPSPYPALAGSDRGSSSSLGQLAASSPRAPQVITPVPGYFPTVAVGPNGEYVNLSSEDLPMQYQSAVQQQQFAQANSNRQFAMQQAQGFYPQSYSPDHFTGQNGNMMQMNGMQGHPQMHNVRPHHVQRPSHHSRLSHVSQHSRSSFPSPGLPGQQGPNGQAYLETNSARSGSPLHYSGNEFFMPARLSQKVSIRAPIATGPGSTHSEESLDPKRSSNAAYASLARSAQGAQGGQGQMRGQSQEFVPQVQASSQGGFNPYSAHNGMYYAGDVNGMDYSGMNGMGDGMYYQTANGEFWPGQQQQGQGQGQMHGRTNGPGGGYGNMGQEQYDYAEYGY